MPRLSPILYLERHDVLRDVWLHDQICFGRLTVAHQLDLHKYYQPSVEMTDLQLLEIRRKLDSEEPSLGSRVGKLYVQIYSAYLDELRFRELRALAEVNPAPKSAKPTKRKKGVRTRLLQSERRLSVLAVARPEPDIQKLSRAVMLIAQQRAKAQDQRDGAQRAADAASAWASMHVPGGFTESAQDVVDGAGIDVEEPADRS